MGEPSRGSTGVHEAGYCAYDFEQVMNCFDWPTLALLDTTLRDAPRKQNVSFSTLARVSGKDEAVSYST